MISALLDLAFPPERYDGVYGDRRRASGYGLYTALGIERSDQEARLRQMLENYRFFGAPEAPFDWYYTFLSHWGSVSANAATFSPRATAGR